MSGVETLVAIDQVLDETYRVVISVKRVPPSHTFPDGIKSRYVLINMHTGKPVLLFDNHEPFGYHWHPDPAGQKALRLSLPTAEYGKALDLFWKKVEEVRGGNLKCDF